MKLSVIAGAQYGSEAKGHVTAQVVKGYLRSSPETPVVNVRVAGPNAGHTVVDADGNHIALRQIPVGAAISDDVILYIAPGSEVDLSVVVAELEKLRSSGHKVSNLYVSGEATLLEDHHIEEERRNDLAGKLGSTAKGIGAARADRIWRGAKRVIDDENAVVTLTDLGVIVEEDNLAFWRRYKPGTEGAIVIEGTQGHALGLHAGRYPYCTSSDTRAIDFIAMSGYPYAFSVAVEVILVARMYPIRVAGNSGEIQGETSWGDLGLPEERTTVTQKTRRVGEWDLGLVQEAVETNGGAQVPSPLDALFQTERMTSLVVLTMVDQKWPLLEGLEGNWHDIAEDLNDAQSEQYRELQDFILELHAAGVPVGAVTTSPSTILTGTI